MQTLLKSVTLEVSGSSLGCHFSYLPWVCQGPDARKVGTDEAEYIYTWEWCRADECKWKTLHWDRDRPWEITLIPEVFRFSFCLHECVNLNELKPVQAQCTVVNSRRRQRNGMAEHSVRVPGREDCPELDKRFISDCIIFSLSSDSLKEDFNFFFHYFFSHSICLKMCVRLEFNQAV